MAPPTFKKKNFGVAIMLRVNECVQKKKIKCWSYALNLVYKYANNNKSRFNLFVLINQQYIMCMCNNSAPTYDHRISS